MRQLALSALFSLLLLQVSCGGCPTREITEERSNGIEFDLVVTDENDQTFTEDNIDFNFPYPSGIFQLNGFYVFDTRSQPEDNTTLQFYFKNNALPNGQDIFDQVGGESYSFNNSPYNGENIIYEEYYPPNQTWTPTSYSGTVSFPDSTHVQFDLTFTDGIQSREVQALFFFDTVTFDQPIGECD